MKLKHLLYILAASLMLFSVSVPATVAIAKEQTASPAANQTVDGYPNSSNGGRGGGGSSAPGGFKGPAKPAPKTKPKPKSNKGKKGKKKSKKKKKKKKSKKKNSKKKKKKKKKSKTQAQKYNEAKKKGKPVKGKHSVTHHVKGLKFPNKWKPYSSADLYKNGKLDIRRYYGKGGRAQTDIHYSNHGNSKLHPKVPHRHDWRKNRLGHWETGPWY